MYLVVIVKIHVFCIINRFQVKGKGIGRGENLLNFKEGQNGSLRKKRKKVA
jgi:hypothetical protein